MKVFEGVSHHVNRSKRDPAKRLARWCLLAGALAYLPLSHAAITDAAFDKFMSTVYGNNVTVSYGAGGVPVSSSAAALGRSYPTATATANAATGGFTLARSVPLAVGGKVYDLAASLPISKAGVASAAKGAFAMAGGPIGIALLAAPSIIAYLNSANLRQDPAQPSQFVFQMKDPAKCTVAPCYNVGFKFAVPDAWTYGNWDNASATCAAAAAAYVNGGWSARNPRITASGTKYSTAPTCTIDFYYNGVYNSTTNGYASIVQVSPTSGDGYKAATLADVETELAKVSATEEALQQLANVLALQADLGVSPSLSGPSIGTAKTETSTSTSPAGTTTKSTTCTPQFTYTGNTATASEVCTTTTTNPDGTQTTEQTTKASPTDPSKAADDPCNLNPERIGCKNLDTPTDQIPKVTKNVTFAAENLGLGNGQCPADTVVTTSRGTYTISWSSYCSMVTTFIKPLIIALAMLSAFFIVAPIKEA